MILYSLNSIIQRYGEETVLDIDRLDIESGAIHALLGANGAGKTTLLEILAFLTPPVQGSIRFQGQLIDRSNIRKFREKVVLVDQLPIMFSRSVAANVAYGLKVRKVGGKKRERIVARTLELVDLYRYQKKDATELSGGEKQRLALARAVALRPDVLLCDEPTANVDLANSRSIEALLKRINSELKTTIIFTSHDRMQPASLTGSHIILERGRITTTRYQNCFRCTAVQQGDNKRMVCRLENTAIEIFGSMLAAEISAAGRGRISIDPAGISLCRSSGDLQGNRIGQGQVMAIMAERQNICLVVDIGVPFSVLMNREGYRQLAPAVGEKLHLLLDQGAASFAAG
ncbi:MAG: hypothetical protein CSB34_07520 [Desulfobulbus propionicus]|nr:MAG: hypothetical protein CSB34_07520 [Desulfobulbus propionicus]